MSFIYIVGSNWSTSIFNNPTTQSTRSKVTKISDLAGRLSCEWDLIFVYDTILKICDKIVLCRPIVRLALDYVLRAWCLRFAIFNPIRHGVLDQRLDLGGGHYYRLYIKNKIHFHWWHRQQICISKRTHYTSKVLNMVVLCMQERYWEQLKKAVLNAWEERNNF